MNEGVTNSRMLTPRVVGLAALAFGCLGALEFASIVAGGVGVPRSISAGVGLAAWIVSAVGPLLGGALLLMRRRGSFEAFAAASLAQVYMLVDFLRIVPDDPDETFIVLGGPLVLLIVFAVLARRVELTSGIRLRDDQA